MGKKFITDILEFNEYQKQARATRLDSTRQPYYAVLGLCSEVGEVAGKYKKYIRDGNDNIKDDLIFELGDCLWYLAAIADDLDIDLSLIAYANISKLTARKQTGNIKGSGDKR